MPVYGELISATRWPLVKSSVRVDLRRDSTQVSSTDSTASGAEIVQVSRLQSVYSSTSTSETKTEYNSEEFDEVRLKWQVFSKHNALIYFNTHHIYQIGSYT